MAKGGGIGFEKEVIAEMIGIGATKAIGKMATSLLSAVAKGHMENHGNRLSSMLIGMPETVEKIFTISVAYALEQGTIGPVEDRDKWINQAQHDEYWRRLANDLPREKNNLYRLIIVQDWIDSWTEQKDFFEVIRLTANAISTDAKLSHNAWMCKIQVLDLDQPVLPFSLKKRIEDLETEKKNLKDASAKFWQGLKKPAYIAGSISLVIILIFITVAVIRS